MVLRNSAAAIVGNFVLSLALSGILELLALVKEWFTDLHPWIDWNFTQIAMFEGQTSSAQEWARLGSTTMIWIITPRGLLGQRAVDGRTRTSRVRIVV